MPGFSRRLRVTTLVELWDRFCFALVPTDVYALLRIAVATVGLLSLAGLLPVSMFWLPGGLLPDNGVGAAIRQSAENLGLGAALGWAFFVATTASFVCMLVGYRTWLAVSSCFIASALQKYWNTLPLAGGHEVMVVVLFCLVWADCRGRLSVDYWLARRRRAADTFPLTYPICPIRLLQFHVAFIYINSALWKLVLGAPWRDGSTVYYVLNLNLFQRFPGTFTDSSGLVSAVLTYGTMLWEFTFPFMLFNKWTRRATLIGGVLLHVGLAIALELGTFSWIMIASYLAFLEPDTATRVVTRLLSKWRTDPREAAAETRAAERVTN